VEIWQVDSRGVYLNTRDQHAARDPNFQGFGRFLTGSSGEYYFRTIKPVAYPGRTRHIHFAIKLKGRDKWTTQCYVKGEPLNARDGVLQGIQDAKARESVMVDFAAVQGSRAGELAAKFDIVMGFTPEG
jgi:protocatechuate 3,4-dioxygenase beta subunit